MSCTGALAKVANGTAVAAPPTTVWDNGRWNIVQFDPGSGRYGYLGQVWVPDHKNQQPDMQIDDHGVVTPPSN